MKNEIFISIITLTKNDTKGLFRTLCSILNQNFNKRIELLILDGSNKKIYDSNSILLDKETKKTFPLKKYLIIRHIDMQKKDIRGIYKCMNYGLLKSKGKSIIFLNGGDSLYDDNTLRVLDLNNFNSSYKKVVSFGQANIISKIGVTWKFPGSKLKNISLWLKYFEPNHQSMLVSTDIAKSILFKEDCEISADKFWKRDILKKVESVKYLDFPVCNFYLDGCSSKRPNIKILITQFKDKRISLLRKILIFVKFLIFPSFYKYLPYFLKIKSKVVDYIF